MTFADAISECGLIAILRGITTAEVEAVGQALVDAGIRVAEIPLNSPDPFASIEKMATAFKGKLVVGAGTVLSVQDVNLLKAHGGQISVSPDCNEAVIARAKELGLEPVARCLYPHRGLCRHPRWRHPSQIISGGSRKPRNRQGLARRICQSM